MIPTPARPPGTSAPPGPRGFARRFWPPFGLGLVGVATLPLVLTPLLRAAPRPPGVPDLPLAARVALSMVNPVLLLAGGAALGATFAPRVGLRSHVAERAGTGAAVWPTVRAEAPLALGAGLALALATALLDAALQPRLGPGWAAAAERATPGTVASLVSGLLYGGITEEVMLRWGVLSLLAWAGWRVAQRGRGALGAPTAWAAIIVSALLFGAGHLPAAAAVAPLTGWVVARTLLLNALGGVVFGWLYWRRSLEAAMLAHAAAHVGFALLALAGRLVP